VFVVPAVVGVTFDVRRDLADCNVFIATEMFDYPAARERHVCAARDGKA
jgi:hypothetical protein